MTQSNWPLSRLTSRCSCSLTTIMNTTSRFCTRWLSYVLANWTGDEQQVVLLLSESCGEATLITGADRMHLPAPDVQSGQVTLTVPARSAALVEQRVTK